MTDDIQRRLEAAGVTRIMLPMQSANPLMGHVNAWRAGDALAFDTGRDDADTRAAWDRLGGMPTGADLVCTHGHSDHMGLARHFAETAGVTVWVTPGEAERIARRAARPALEARAIREAFLVTMGAQKPGANASAPLPFPPTRLPDRWSALEEGQVIASGTGTWRVLLGAGHSPQPALLVEEQAGLVITGDQILTEMTPFVGVDFDDPDANPLAEMIGFLEVWRSLDDAVIGLPGHGVPFTGVGRRAGAHLAAYARRLERVLQATRTPVTCAEILSAMFRVARGERVTDVHYAMAGALLNYLIGQGRLRRAINDDGAYRYTAA